MNRFISNRFSRDRSFGKLLCPFCNTRIIFPELWNPCNCFEDEYVSKSSKKMKRKIKAPKQSIAKILRSEKLLEKTDNWENWQYHGWHSHHQPTKLLYDALFDWLSMTFSLSSHSVGYHEFAFAFILLYYLHTSYVRHSLDKLVYVI